MKKLLVFAFIPLILSIGITPTFSFGEIIDSPRKQMQNGITATDVVCKSGLALMIRISGDAACVKSTSVKKLTIIGFGTSLYSNSLAPNSCLRTRRAAYAQWSGCPRCCGG